MAAYVICQILVPARAWWMGGSSAWSSDGFNWAWKVMIVEKRGTATFIAHEGGKSWRIDPRAYLTPRQITMMAQDPYLIRDFARWLARDLQQQGHPDIEIRCNAFASLNGRPSQRIIDPSVDLTSDLKPGWIIPLEASPAPPRVATPAVVHSPMR